MNLIIPKYLLFIVLAISIVSCRQAKYVPDDYYLLKENAVVFKADEGKHEWVDEYDQLNEGEILELVRPEPNSKFKLFVYNRIDSARYQKQITHKREKFQVKNEKRQAKADKKNEKRIRKARDKGKTHYKKKVKEPKEVRLGWRNWVVEHWGEAPVLLDTSKVSKSKQQMDIYLSKRGFKNATISDTIVFNEKRQKAWVTYKVTPGKPYVINSITFDDAKRNAGIRFLYDKMVRKEGTAIKVGDLLDEDKLDEERDHYTKFLKDNAFFGFTKNYINFVVDTTVGDFKADVVIYIKEKTVPNPNNPDTTVVINHYSYQVNDVTYKLHNPDSISFKDYNRFKERCDSLGLPYSVKGQFTLLDTLFVIDTTITVYHLNFNSDRRKDHNLKIFQKYVDTTINYKGYFIYNEEPFLTPDILDKQNFLEHTEPDYPHYAKDYYVDRTFQSFLRLDVFSRITPKMEITPSKPLGNLVDVTYDLTPQRKQQFTIEPRATNTSSILGVSGMISYSNKNMFKSANQLKVKLEGGAQSQPLIVGNGSDGGKIFEIRELNTFEWGPTITYRIPRFYPMTKKMQETISKRAFPSTDIELLYNYQKRPEFRRHIAELAYKWQFSPADPTQIYTVTPLIFNYVFINKDTSFANDLIATGDQYLINSYSDFFSLGVLNIAHEYNNMKKPKVKRKTSHNINNVIELTAAGLVLNSIYAMFDKSQSFNASFNQNGKEVFAVPFAQFIRIENTFTFNQHINKGNRMVYRFIAGIGDVYGNSISLPYTQSFVAGGSNDIRAFDARTMAPGGIQTYLDPNATQTQIGDMKLELNVEWRVKFSSIMQGALFIDAGNIWKLIDDPTTLADNRGVFKINDFWRYTAIGTGFGLRADFTYLIVRLDFAWSLHNPYLPDGEKWWTTGKGEYKSYFQTDPDDPSKLVDYIRPHPLNFNFGIGYPF
ncbi:MAG: BamA/TamA family outer membrane protein [Crocinitomicaceae bacterium]|nr:BamA/TamA family outer membrane protein [Crocinitomicaceae bacterium]